MTHGADRDVPRHPIGVVVRRTGMKPDVVRAWERRYGAVQPGRSRGAQRLYSDRDLERLVLLRQATLAGRSIGQVAGLADDELRGLVASDQRTTAPAGRPASAQVVPVLLDGCVSAIRRLDPDLLRNELQRAASVLSRRQMIEDLLAPLMEKVGVLWQEGRLRPVHEHAASSTLIAYAGEMLRSYRPLPGAPSIVTGTPAGHRHEIGALLAATLAAGEGWNATYLGPDLPADDIALAARERDARVVAIGATWPSEAPVLLAELAHLGRALGRNVMLVVGGRAADQHRDALAGAGAQHVASLGAFREMLALLATGPPGERDEGSLSPA